MIRSFGDASPRVAETAWVSEAARSFVIGSPTGIREATPEQVSRLEARGRPDGGYAAMVRRYRELGL